MMLFHCNNFKIFGDGGSRLILIATTPDGNQDGFIVHNPFIDSLTMRQDVHEVFYKDDRFKRYCPGVLSSSLSMRAGEVECITGPDLERIYDPVMQRSIRELLAVINTKLEER